MSFSTLRCHVAHTTIDALRNTCVEPVDLVGLLSQVVPDTVGNVLGVDVAYLDRLVMAPHSRYQFQGTIQPVDMPWRRQPRCGVGIPQ